jgi:hypothetical protein
MRDVTVVIPHYTTISAFKISPRRRKLIKATPNSHLNTCTVSDSFHVLVSGQNVDQLKDCCDAF